MSKKKDVVSIADLVPDNKNANTGTERGASALEHSLRQYGAGRSVLVDRNNRIIAGNKTIETAASIGMENAVLVETTGDRVVVVRRADIDLDSPEGRGLAIADNRAGELNLAWNQEVLAELGEEIDLSPYFFEDELDFAGIEEPVEGLTDEDDVPELGESPVSERGDVWILGNHRVMCGDSTDAADVALLMDGEKADLVFTDPPYGMNLNANYSAMKGFGSGNKYSPVIGDNDDFKPELIRVPLELFSYCREVFIWGADYFSELLPDRNSGSWIVWDKRLDESADKMFGSCFELCWSKSRHKRKIARIKWAGMFGLSNDLGGQRVHPTQKPTALIQWFLDEWAAGSGLVVDVYLGSGATLIAAEKTSRKCYGMEISPAYVDVIIKRWQDFTGKEAVHESGRTYQEMSDVRS
tara:strand:- start:779 stop:2011 length:1233 start_codon:yes stop_codon:yes gene_type:complete